MKKTILLMLCVIMLLSLCACAKDKPVTGYDELVVKLDEAVVGILSEDLGTKIEEGKYPSPTGEHEEKWNEMLLDGASDFRGVDENAFGYKLIDVNSDAIPELIFCRTDDTVLAVFTLREGKVALVDAYSRDYRCAIRDTGELYSMTVRDDGGYEFRISTLNPSTATLYTTVNFGTEGSICYEEINGTVYTTSSERILELREEYPYEHAKAYIDAEFNLF